MTYLWNDTSKIAALKNKQPLVLFLDFDGTLIPLAKSPEKVRLPNKLKVLLQSLHQKQSLYLVVISGRSLSDIKKRIGIKGLIYGGNHGLEGEILGQRFTFLVKDQTLKALTEINKQLEKEIKKYKGFIIEDKKLTLSFHYRSADKAQVPEVLKLLKKILLSHVQNEISILTGKEVIEIIPKVNWDKGYFADFVLKKIFEQTKKHPTAIMIGDDKTDEKVFGKLTSGITITIGEKLKSKAKYFLKNTDEVTELLKWLEINL